MLESNYLSMLLKPNFEKPVDSPQDIIDRRLTVILMPSGGSNLEMMKNSPYPIIKALTNLTEISKVISMMIFLVSEISSQSFCMSFWIQVSFYKALLHR